jgi:hypothetical protein
VSEDDRMGDAGGGEGGEPETDPEVKDYGPPAEGEAEVGTSGADEGLSPWAPESYEPEPEGPTHSTED